MDHFDQQPEELPPMALTADSVEYLRTASTWARFLAILGFIATALIVIFSIGIFMFLRSRLPDLPPRDPGVIYSDSEERARTMANTLPIFYLVFAAIYFYICRHLYRFANATRSAIEISDSGELEHGVKNLASFFKTFGILAILGLAFYLIVIVSAISTIFTWF
ncbi:MAG TPA: hypothetical protein VGD90_00870 [Sphingobacteriaceae bacterium]